MSKLYNMIEDALMKKGLSIPSDSFVFTADYKPSDEILKALTLQDDVYTKDTYTDEDLKTEGIGKLDYMNNLNVQKDSDAKIEVIDAKELIDNAFTDDEKNVLWKNIDTNDATYKLISKEANEGLKLRFLELFDTKFKAQLVDNNIKAIESIENDLADIENKIKVTEEEIASIENEIKKDSNKDNKSKQQEESLNEAEPIQNDLKNKKIDAENKLKELKNTQSRLNDDLKARQEKLSTEKNALIESFAEFQKLFYNRFLLFKDIPDFLNNTIKDIENLKTVINIFTNSAYTTNDAIKQALINSEIISKNSAYPYKQADIQKIEGNALNKENVISSEGNKSAVEDALHSLGLSEELMYKQFEFNPGDGNPPFYVSVGGIYKDELENDDIKHILLRRVESRNPINKYSTSKNDVYKYTNEMIQVPINKLKATLLDNHLEYLTGLPTNLEDKGEFVPLSDDQVKTVLVKCMWDFKNGKRSEDIYAEDLLSIFEKNPGAAVIGDALKTFSKNHVIRKFTKDKKIVYEILVPYKNSNNNLGIPVNSNAKRFKQYIGLK